MKIFSETDEKADLQNGVVLQRSADCMKLYAL